MYDAMLLHARVALLSFEGSAFLYVKTIPHDMTHLSLQESALKSMCCEGSAGQRSLPNVCELLGIITAGTMAVYKGTVTFIAAEDPAMGEAKNNE